MFNFSSMQIRSDPQATRKVTITELLYREAASSKAQHGYPLSCSYPSGAQIRRENRNYHEQSGR